MAERLPRQLEPLSPPFEPLPRPRLRAGQAIVRQGERCSGLWRVESGVLRASTVDDEGRELTLDLMGPGDVAGEPGGDVSPVTLRAMGPTRLHALHPSEAAPLLADRARRREALACDLAWRGVKDRVLHRLDDLAARFGRPVPAGTAIDLALTQDDLASLAGTSRESANRALRRLEREGRVRVSGRHRYVLLRRLRSVGP